MFRPHIIDKHKRIRSYIVTWNDRSILVFWHQFFRRERKPCCVYRCIPIVRCKGQPIVRYNLPTRSYGYRRPDGFACLGLNDLAKVRITFFATCHPLSYYGPSARPIKTSASNTESDAEINCIYRPLSP